MTFKFITLAKVVTLAAAATTLGSLAASAQTTTIIEQRPGVVVQERAPVVIEQRPAGARRFSRHRVEDDHDDDRHRTDRRLRDADRAQGRFGGRKDRQSHRLPVSCV
jgi:hypothetical protein